MKKILICYSSKTGTTKNAAEKIAQTLKSPCTLFDLGDSGRKSLQLSEYNVVIIGTSMRIGTPRKDFISFLKQNKGELAKKKVILFTCGIAPEEQNKKYLFKRVPEVIEIDKILYRHLDGELNLDKFKGFDRPVIENYLKKNPAPVLNLRAINEICSAAEREESK